MPADPFALVLRCLPSIIVFVLAFVAAADKSSRERWAEIMYQLGTIKPDQRNDPKVQRGVRLPFFIVAVLLLLWPINYFRKAARKLQEVEPTGIVVKKPDSSKVSGNAASTVSNAAPGAANAATGSAAPAAPTIAPQTSAPAAGNPAPMPLQR